MSGIAAEVEETRVGEIGDRRLAVPGEAFAVLLLRLGDVEVDRTPERAVRLRQRALAGAPEGGRGLRLLHPADRAAERLRRSASGRFRCIVNIGSVSADFASINRELASLEKSIAQAETDWEKAMTELEAAPLAFRLASERWTRSCPTAQPSPMTIQLPM